MTNLRQTKIVCVSAILALLLLSSVYFWSNKNGDLTEQDNSGYDLPGFGSNLLNAKPELKSGLGDYLSNSGILIVAKDGDVILFTFR